MKPIFLCLLFCWACQKKWETPAIAWAESKAATHSLRQLRAHHIPGNTERLLEEWTIKGQVTANDASDNFYKTIVIQDSSGALPILLDAFALHLDFPIGMQVRVRLKGLYLGEHGGMLQLGGGVDRSQSFPDLQPIPGALVNTCVFKEGPKPLPMPQPFLPEQLGYWQQGCLVQLTGVELGTQDTGKTFADARNKTAMGYALRNCQNGTLYLRTSGFAQFAGQGLPNGNGNAVGIFTVFGSQKQLQIRDTQDLKMNGSRCGLPQLKTLLAENFEGAAPGQMLALPGWKNLAEAGKERFQTAAMAGNQFASINGAFTQAPQLSNWLVLPPIDLSATTMETLQFVTRDGHDNGAQLQVLVSGQYDGGQTPWQFRWTPLKAIVAKGSPGNPTHWVDSGPLSLQGFSGRVYIAFKYEGADPAPPGVKKTTQFQIDDILVRGRE